MITKEERKGKKIKNNSELINMSVLPTGSLRTTVFFIILFSLFSCSNPNSGTPDPCLTEHDWGEWAETTAPTCTEKGVETRICRNNSTHTETQEIDPLGHDWETIEGTEPTCTEKGSGTRECKVCSETETGEIPIDPNAHDWGEWAETTAPTCTDKGEETRACEHDNTHTEKRDVDPLGHDWEAIGDGKAPTCTEEGHGTLQCKVCDQTVTGESIPIDPTAHDWGEWIKTTEPTCTDKGEETRTCEHNNTHTEKQEVDPLGHDFGEWADKTPATCTEAGTQERVCKHNPAHTETQYNPDAPALDHDWGDWSVTTVMTCISYGEETRICKRDDTHIEKRDIIYDPFLSHDWNDDWVVTTAPTCTQKGEETRTCKRNPAHTEKREVDINPSAHGYGIFHTTPATCTEFGERESRCYRCQAVLNTQPINPLGHNIQMVAIPATATTNGIEGLVCIRDNCTHTQGTPQITYATGTAGLSYSTVWIDGYPVFSVSGGTVLGGDIFIPTFHRANAQSPYRSVAHIAEYAFNNKVIKSVNFIEGSQLKIIGLSAFEGSALEYIVIPASVTSIVGRAFENCNLLTTVYYMGADEAAWNEITIGDLNTQMVEATRYYYSENQPTTTGRYWRYIDGVPTPWAHVIHDMQWVTTTPATETTNGIETLTCSICGHTDGTRFSGEYAFGSRLAYTLNNDETGYIVTGVDPFGAGIMDRFIPAFRRPNAGSPYLPVVAIADGAFNGHTMFTSVTFAAESQLETIGNDAFRGTRFSSITIPASVKTIGDNAFMNCTLLDVINFVEGSQLETIGDSAFLTTIGLLPRSRPILIPASVKFIGEDAFMNRVPLYVYYGGANATDWNKIEIKSGNDSLINPGFYRLYFSATVPTTSGNFWRYVDGVPTDW